MSNANDVEQLLNEVWNNIQACPDRPDMFYINGEVMELPRAPVVPSLLSLFPTLRNNPTDQ